MNLQIVSVCVCVREKVSPCQLGCCSSGMGAGGACSRMMGWGAAETAASSQWMCPVTGLLVSGKCKHFKASNWGLYLKHTGACKVVVFFRIMLLDFLKGRLLKAPWS